MTTPANPVTAGFPGLTNFQNRHVIRSVYDVDYAKSNCWWDLHPIGPSCERLHTVQTKIHKTYYLVGVFCSWACAKAYSQEHNYDIGHFYTWYTQKTSQTNFVRRAPPRELLQLFGGRMSIKAFRSALDKPIYSYEVLLPPHTVIVPKVVEFECQVFQAPLDAKLNISNVLNEKLLEKQSLEFDESERKRKRSASGHIAKKDQQLLRNIMYKKKERDRKSEIQSNNNKSKDSKTQEKGDGAHRI